VVGVQAALEALVAEATMIQDISGELVREVVSDRMAFVANHQRMVDSLRDRADEVESEVALLARAQLALADQKALLKRREADVASYEIELAASRAATAVEMAKLTAMSKRLFEFRVILRDTERGNKRDYQTIVELEKKIRELENTARLTRKSGG